MRGFKGGLALALVLLSAAALGVGGAAGSPSEPGTVVVEVIGNGGVASSGNGISCGSGNTSCYVTLPGKSAGDTITLTATAATGWSFSESTGWTGCAPTTGTSCTLTLATGGNRVEADFSTSGNTPLRTLAVSAPTVGGDVTDAPSPPGTKVDCGSGGGGSPPPGTGTVCTWEVIDQSTLTVVETPDDAFFFNGWGGDCAAASSSKACTVQMTADRSASAAFASATTTSTLTTHVVGSGTITGGGITCGSGATCDRSEASSTAVTLTATNAGGYLFTGWSGACTGTQASCTLDMSADRDVTATFVQGFTLRVTVNGNGSVNGGTGFGLINCGPGAGTACTGGEAASSTVTLTEVPATGATFTGWSGACSGLSTICTVTMNTDRTVTANFSGGTGGLTVPLTVSVTGSGTVSGTAVSCASLCTANEQANATVTLSAIPASGGTFNGWGGACSGSFTTCTVTMTSAQTVSASFSTVGPSAFPLSVTVSGNGSVSGGGISCGKTGTACTQSLAPGTSITLRATPAKGARFVRWTGDCTGTAASCVLVVGQARSVVATFSGGTGGSSAAALSSLGAPIVVKATHGYRVTLRFRTSSAGMVVVEGLRAGRVLTSFQFESPVGSRTVGPFPLTLTGYYTFRASLVGRSDALVWHACLGSCGRHSPAGAGTFTVAKRQPVLRRAGAGWLVTLRFFESKPSGTAVEVLRAAGGSLGRYEFAPAAGSVSLRRLVLSPGSYRLRLTATDAYGRVGVLVYSLVLRA